MADIAFIDSETRSPLDVTAVGAYKYANHPDSEILVWSYALDDDHCETWSPDWAWGQRYKPDPMYPDALLDHVEAGGYVVAWNAFFDRWIWNAVMVPKYNWPYLPVDQVLCAQAQAEASNLPGGLEKAAETLGTYFKKDPAGKRLIGLLCQGTRDDWNSAEHETADHMGRFRAYCIHDVKAMRAIWQATRPLTLPEWREYHASERINDRGVMVDTEFAQAARQYAKAETDDINAGLAEITQDPRLTLSHHQRKAAWLYEALAPSDELREVMTKPPKKKGEAIRKSCDRPTREALLELLATEDYAALFHVEQLNLIVEFLELIEAGNSAAVQKFTKICQYVLNDRVHGQYSFNGAGQTGRFSSRGIQIHNLIRAALAKGDPNRAIDAIEDVLDGMDPEDLSAKYGLPISRLLARLVRPTFIAPDGRLLVWGDWDQIEGRGLPWLAYSNRAESKLDLYRGGVDTYKVAALPIFGLHNLDEVSDDQRQIGKVAELALGFGGAVGAFMSMARNYGVRLPEDEIVRIVSTWRVNNPWARDFWDELWNAMLAAFADPGNWYRAGRVHYLYNPDLMYGTMLCRLPSKRLIVYPQFQHDWVNVRDDDGNVTGTKMRTSYVRSFGSGSARIDLWYGKLAENVTQAIAGDVLRDTLVRLDDIIVLHTHDELVAEVDEQYADYWANELHFEMTRVPKWADGLPLSATVETGPFYTK